ncbi:hypothetical protein D3C76_1276380 [compost metagenome]
MAQDLGAFDNLSGLFLHQPVVGGDIGLAFGSVEDQGFHLFTAALQLTGRWETCAPQTGNPGLMNTLDQLCRVQLAIICDRRQFAPAIFTVWFNNHAQFRQP